MAKHAARELLRVLRQFEIAGELTVPKEITRIQEIEPHAGVYVTRFVYQNTRYVVIIDDIADDNTALLRQHIAQVLPGANGSFVKNPHENDFTTYGLRHKFKDTYLFREESPKSRLDVELSRRFPHITRSLLQKYIKAGHVTCNGEVVTKASASVTELDTIALQELTEANHSEQDLPILYIDDEVLVVNKPAGILTHSKGGLNQEFTVADFMRRYSTFGLQTNRPGIVHRLDRDTSGVIIGARHDESGLLLKKQFADRLVHKRYLAVVEGQPKEFRARIDLPIGRNPSAPSTFRVDPSGKTAITEYEVLATNGKHSLVLLTPETGRTHQLRVHMQYLRTPIVGDRVYGTAKKGQRLMLHALSLEITIPPSQRKTFIAPAPEEFTMIFPEAADA